MNIDRREFMTTVAAALAAGQPRPVGATTSAFPGRFLLGAATSAHQVEGQDVNSDLWVLEHLKPSPAVRRLANVIADGINVRGIFTGACSPHRQEQWPVSFPTRDIAVPGPRGERCEPCHVEGMDAVP